MSAFFEILLVLVVLTNLRMVGTSRLLSCVRGAAAQGVVIGMLVLVSHAERLDLHIVALALGSALLKGIAFPALLMRAVRTTHNRRETEPLIGFTASLGAGVLFVLLGVWLADRLPLPDHFGSALAGPVAFSAVLSGLFLVVARRNALTQVVGYLILENGIFLFGVLFVRGIPWLMDLGVLLDVFVGVFIMGLTIFNIAREFDHIDTDRLAALHDLSMAAPDAADEELP